MGISKVASSFSCVSLVPNWANATKGEMINYHPVCCASGTPLFPPLIPSGRYPVLLRFALLQIEVALQPLPAAGNQQYSAICRYANYPVLLTVIGVT